MSVTAKISSKYQVSIPKDVREEMAWATPGRTVVFVPRGGTLVMTPSRDFDSLRGLARGADPENYRDRKDRF